MSELSEITFSEQAKLVPLQQLAVNLLKARRKTEKCLISPESQVKENLTLTK